MSYTVTFAAGMMSSLSRLGHANVMLSIRSSDKHIGNAYSKTCILCNGRKDANTDHKLLWLANRALFTGDTMMQRLISRMKVEIFNARRLKERRNAGKSRKLGSIHIVTSND